MRYLSPILLSAFAACSPVPKEETPPSDFPIFECDGTTLIETTGVEITADGHMISEQAIERNSPRCM